MHELPRRVRLALVALVLATPGLTYWIAGDLSEPGDKYYLDRIWREPISERLAMMIGVVALVVVLSAIALICASADVRIHAWLAWTVALLMSAGVIAAVGVRVTTARVSGANIGGGLYVLLGLPLCLALVIVASVIARRAARSAQ